MTSMKTRFCSIRQLQENQIERMLQIMNQYYTNVSAEVFRRDLIEKDDVILLEDQAGDVQGFSTLVVRTEKVGKKKFISIFSGDTVLDRKFWGNGALPMAFGRYIFRIKLANPFTDVYWFLISKGFKTYLLMANNFVTYYPRFDKKTPLGVQIIMDYYYRAKFGKCYSDGEGLIRFDSQKKSSIRESSHEIGVRERLNPRVAFFEQRNSKWIEGEELACVAKVSLFIPFFYILKRLRRSLTRAKKN